MRSDLAILIVGAIIETTILVLDHRQRREARHNHGDEMSQLDDLNSAITDLQSDASTLSTEVGTAITDIEAAATAQNVDLSGPIAALKATHVSLQQLATNLNAVEVPATTEPTGDAPAV